MENINTLHAKRILDGIEEDLRQTYNFLSSLKELIENNSYRYCRAKKEYRETITKAHVKYERGCKIRQKYGFQPTILWSDFSEFLLFFE